MADIVILLLCLILIVISSNLFCNALEHFGEKLGISEGVTGSVFAAIGTALPETIIPIIAILTADHNNISNVNNEIGIGAILGAPLMLSTLSLFLMSISVITKRGINGTINPEPTGLKRDLKFFLLSYGIVFLTIFAQGYFFSKIFNIICAIVLAGCYILYLVLTFKSSNQLVVDGHNTEATEKLTIQHLGFKVNFLSIFLQIIFAMWLLIYFANMFINSIKHISGAYNLSPFLLSLIIIPIATEMPEKLNSIIWLRKFKDTLAIGNITGAMVFQSSLLPIIGILFTDWRLTNAIQLTGIIITFIATIIFYLNACREKIKVWHFFINGLLYLLNIVICIQLFY